MIDVTLNAIKQRFIRLLTSVSECQQARSYEFVTGGAMLDIL